MDRRHILRLSAITVLGLSLLPGGALAQQKSLKEQLVGTWTVVSWDQVNKDGSKFQRFGANPKGVLMLEVGGRYALVQGKPDRPKFKTSGNLRLDTPAAEWGEAAREFAANFGTWSVSEADKTLTRKYEIALIPNNDSLETKVSISLAGDELKLVGTSPTGVKTESVYRRAK